MKFGVFVTFLFLVFDTSFYMVIGQETIKSDCTILYNFINNDDKDYGNDCCLNYQAIECDDNGYIKSIHGTNEILGNSDLTNFPYFSKIEKLVIDYNYGLKEIPLNILKLTSLTQLELNNNDIVVVPPVIQNLSKLQILNLDTNNIKELPNKIFYLSNLKRLSIVKNNIEVIPPEIQKLSLLEGLYLNNNVIKELPNELFNLPSLKYIDLGVNKIEAVPPTVQNLSNLIELGIDNNNIKELPSKIFNLPNLKYLDLQNNQNLNVKLINFNNSPIDKCHFSNINISCYQRNTCKNITYNNLAFEDSDTPEIFNICTQKEIEEIINEKEGKENKTKSPIIIIGGIIGCIFGVLVSLILIKKFESKQNKNSNLNSNDEFRTGSIRVLFSNNYNSNNPNGGVTNNNINNNNSNNNNSNNNNYNYNNSNNSNNNNNNNGINNNNNNNIYYNLNQNIMINSNDHNSNTSSGRIVFINSPPPQNPGNLVMNNIPIYNDNNQNNDQESLDMQKSPLYYDNESNGYITSVTEGDEPPPEYTEINK